MDDIFIIILNVVCAVILIGYVIHSSIKKQRIKKAEQVAKSEQLSEE